jgi:hypothetical protein
MTTQQFKDVMSTYKKGTYISMVWETITPNGRKVSKGVVRFTDVEIKTNKQGEEYIVARITKNNKLHTHTTYFNNLGEEISKEEYVSNNKTYNITDYFAKHLKHIIQLRQCA